MVLFDGDGGRRRREEGKEGKEGCYGDFKVVNEVRFWFVMWI